MRAESRLRRLARIRSADRRRAQSGSALIEALVALVVLAIGGTGLITLLGQTARSMRTTLESERQARAASDEISRVAVAPRAELLQLVGHRSVNGWTIDVEVLSPALFAVSVALSDTTGTLLHTTLYRPAMDSADAAR